MLELPRPRRLVRKRHLHRSLRDLPTRDFDHQRQRLEPRRAVRGRDLDAVEIFEPCLVELVVKLALVLWLHSDSLSPRTLPSRSFAESGPGSQS